MFWILLLYVSLQSAKRVQNPEAALRWSKQLFLFFKFRKIHNNTVSFVKFAGHACNFIENETAARMFSWEYIKIFENNYFIEQLRKKAPKNQRLSFT